jgi:hypothetical protein
MCEALLFQLFFCVSSFDFFLPSFLSVFIRFMFSFFSFFVPYFLLSFNCLALFKLKDVQEKNKELEKYYETEEAAWKTSTDSNAMAKKELAAQLLATVNFQITNTCCQPGPIVLKLVCP